MSNNLYVDKQVKKLYVNGKQVFNLYVNDTLVFSAPYTWSYSTSWAGNTDYSPIKYCSITDSEGVSVTTMLHGQKYKFNLALNNGVKCTKSNTFSNIPDFTGKTEVSEEFTCISGGEIQMTLEPLEYTLTISKGTGVSSVTVTRTSSPIGGGSTGALSTGATIYYNDKLTVTAVASSGYSLDSYDTEVDVTGNKTISVSAVVVPWAYTLISDSGCTNIKLTRTNNSIGGGKTGELITLTSGKATVYYGDKFTITYSANTGYTVSSSNVSVTITSNNQNNTIGTTPTKYTLTISKGTGVSSVTVTRTSSPIGGGSTGALSTGATIYYNDKLTVTAVASSGYSLDSYDTEVDVEENTSVSISAQLFTYVLKIFVYDITGIIPKFYLYGDSTYYTPGELEYSVYPNGDSKTKDTYKHYILCKNRHAGDDIYFDTSASEGYYLSSPWSGSFRIQNADLTEYLSDDDLKATPLEYTLTISKGTGVSSVTVTRTSSPIGGGSTGALSTGATIYYNDKLTVTAVASSGYSLDSYAGSITVSGDYRVNITAYKSQWVFPTQFGVYIDNKYMGKIGDYEITSLDSDFCLGNLLTSADMDITITPVSGSKKTYGGVYVKSYSSSPISYTASNKSDKVEIVLRMNWLFCAFIRSKFITTSNWDSTWGKYTWSGTIEELETNGLNLYMSTMSCTLTLKLSSDCTASQYSYVTVTKVSSVTGTTSTSTINASTLLSGTTLTIPSGTKISFKGTYPSSSYNNAKYGARWSDTAPETWNAKSASYIYDGDYLYAGYNNENACEVYIRPTKK